MIQINKKPKILVIGDMMVDHYLWGSSTRISPEAPVQVINVDRESTVLGGAGNVINNLKSLEASVDVLSVIGDCDASLELKSLLSQINVKSDYLIIQKNRITSKKSRIIAAQQQVVRYDKECTDEINSKSSKKIIKVFTEIVSDYDLILLSDYGKGILTFEVTQSLISIANKNKKKILIDPKGLDYSKYKGAYLLTPNKKEASEATNINIIDNTSLAKAMLTLKKKCSLKIPLVTLSEEGVALFDKKLQIFPTVAREVFDVTGAGDTILASLGYALSINEDIESAIKFANLASGIVVGKIGAATTTHNEINEYESSLHKTSSSVNIKSWEEISSITDNLKKMGKKIIFSNGCFDILHIGHISYLEKAREFGDVLILGLNSDESVKRLKGNDRPINSQNDRAYILASLEVVDYVVIFDEDTPLKLIKLIQPELLIKGGDYMDKNIVGSQFAEEVKILKYIEGKGTSKIIERIQKS